MSQQPLLSHTEYLTHGLLPIVLSSATNTCYICSERYTEEPERQPVVLPQCGHIFCRTCITTWFDSGQQNSNTCPLDRKALFRAATAQHEIHEDTTAEYNAHALLATHRTPSRAAPRPVEEVFVNGWVVARAGRLTYRGCRLVMHDLWHHAARFLNLIERFAGPVDEPWDMDVEMLRSCIQNAIPSCVRCGEEEWAILYVCVRLMLVWLHDGEWDEGAMEEELRGMAGNLHEAGRRSV